MIDTCEVPPPDRIREGLAPFVAQARKYPEALDDPEFVKGAADAVLGHVGGRTAHGLLEMVRQYVAVASHRDALLAIVRAVRAQKPTLGRVLSPKFTIGKGAKQRTYVYASPLGSRLEPSETYEVVDLDEAEDDPGGAKRRARAPAPELPPPPFLAVLDTNLRVLLGPASEFPLPPVPSEIHKVVAARAETHLPGLGEIEVAATAGELNPTFYCAAALACEVAALLKNGKSAEVRVEGGIATRIHVTDEQAREPYVEYLPRDGPSLFDLEFPRFLREEFMADLRARLKGRPVRVHCQGPTGVGKTEAVIRTTQEAARQAEKAWGCKGAVLIRLTPSYAGSSYAHAYELTIGRALDLATRLAAEKYMPTILMDEADGVLGELNGGYEGHHNMALRLTLQERFTKEIPGVAIYLTSNPRRSSFLPPAIARRFRKRTFLRSSRSQIAKVAALYADADALKSLGLTPQEFGGALADNLFSDGRVVAVGHFTSGEKALVRARDLQTCSPGKVRDLVMAFSNDILDGVTTSLDTIWRAIDLEFQAPELAVATFYDLTFLKPPAHDTLRTVEIVHAGRHAT